MFKNLFFIVILFILAATPNVIAQHAEMKDVVFIQNKGQWESKIKYKADLFAGALFCENNQLTFVLEDFEKARSLKTKSYTLRDSLKESDFQIPTHAYQMEFKHSNEPIITGDYKTPEYFNFFLGNNKETWTSNVFGYGKILYQGIYKGINFNLYPNQHQLKYDFTVAPGSNPNDIQIEYKGVDRIYLKNGNLEINTSVNSVTEIRPYAYQLIDGDTIKINCNFNLRKNTLSYEFPDGYNEKYPLVIDPDLIFASYSGSTTDNWGYTATFDDDGFLYAGGVAFGLGYPTTIGAYQTTFGGANTDIAISKYDTTGNFLIYSTYLGGSGIDVPHSLIVNKTNELIVYGTTGSVNFPTTAGAYDATYNGGTPYTLTYVLNFTGTDMIISKLSADGASLLASTYFGGSGNDGMNSGVGLKVNYADEVRGEVSIDNNNNVYIVTSTQSLNLPTTSGVFQPTFGGGTHDGCIVKMDGNLSNLIWCSYIGGTGVDAAYAIALDENEDIYISGGTSSPNFPIIAGAEQPTFAGGTADGFITKIRKNGTAILYSTFWGSNFYDQLYLLEIDKNSNVYVLGQTKALGNYFIKNALWNNPGGGQVITKFTATLDSVIWSTVFGKATGVPDISPSAFMVDLCNKIYMSGWGGAVNGQAGGNTTGLETTIDAKQASTDGSDYYLLVINDDASDIVYGSFLGGNQSQEHVDGGTSRFDRKGRIYQNVCAGCGGRSDFPVTTSMNTNNSFNCNNAVFKFDFNLPVVLADFELPPVICIPDQNPVIFNNTSEGAATYSWKFGDGTTSTLQNPSHTYSTPGNYTVTLIVSNSGTCNFSDTISKQLLVLSNNPSSLPTIPVCYGTGVQIGYLPYADTSVHYTWTPITGLSDPNISNPVADPVVSTTYNVKVSNGICEANVTQIVKVYDLKMEAGPDRNVCSTNFSLTANSFGDANSFIWSSNPNFSDTLNLNLNDSIAIANITSGTQTYYVKGSSDQCDAIDSVKITLKMANVLADPDKVVCFGDSTTIHATNLISGDNLNYNWAPTSNIISGGTTNTINAYTPSTTTFIVTATNQYGCQAIDSIKISISNPGFSNPIIQNIKCYGDCTGKVKISPSGGYPSYSYNWSTGTSADSIANLCHGTYKVTISDAYSCEAIKSITLNQPDSLHVIISDSGFVICNGLCDAHSGVTVSGGLTPYNYLWNDGQTTATAINLCGGDYTVKITDFNLCSKLIEVPIHDTSSFEAHILSKTDATCYQLCNGKASVVASSGATPYNYIWSNPDSSITNSIDSLCASNYFVTVTDANNCLRKVFVTITEPTQIAVDNDSIKDVTCYNLTNGYAKLNVSGGTPGYTYNWNNIYSGNEQSSLPDGTYIITITDANECEIYDTIVIKEPTPLVLTTDTNQTTCLTSCDGEAWVFASGSVPAYSYFWSNSDTTSYIETLCSGTHYVTVTDQNNCKKYASVTIAAGNYTLSVTASISMDTIYESQQVQLQAYPANGYTYQWSPANILNNPNIANPIAAPLSNTEFTVTVTDSLGCANIASVKIHVKDINCGEPDIFIPNAFSPDGDGFNDVLYVRGNVIENLYFAIYDRWGEKVFETNDQSIGWDGTFRGKPLDPSVYVFYVEAGCISKEKFFKKGNITLIR
ncbi:MAG: gliding motility-associated C-terminal domain-containing protein [Bacteroidota bacterium]